MQKRPVRKANRLECYDYSKPGYYYVTVCTKERRPILGHVTKSDESKRSEVILSRAGILTDKAIEEISKIYPGVSVEKYVIMPNHFHIILSFAAADVPLPNLSRVIQQTKRRVSIAFGEAIWQTHYYDRVIRNEADFQAVWKYIDDNPTKWSLDQYYAER